MAAGAETCHARQAKPWILNMMDDAHQGYHGAALAELANNVWDADATVLGGVWEVVSAGLGGEAY
jgi:hypothetical protein